MSVSSVSYLVSVLSAQGELLPKFLEPVCGCEGSSGKVTLRGIADVYLESYAPETLEQEDVKNRLREADICLLLVDFLDVMTVDQIREILRNLPTNAARNMHVLICRQPGRTDYKISCTKCGQKLMVQDAMAMRRARCPRCQEFFQIPGQVDLVRAELLIPANRLVRKITLGDVAIGQQALETLIRQHTNRSTVTKSTTMRLDLPPEV